MKYRDKLNIPVDIGKESISFYTKTHLFIAQGYNRVVIGGRGPYIEFERKHIENENFFIPKDQKWRLDSKWEYSVYYIEFRSRDESYVKLYYQQKEVRYADYIIGKMYISPFDLIIDGNYPAIR